MSYLRSLFLKLLDGPFVNPTTLVDEMASGGGLARVDVANDHYVDVELLLSHGDAIGQMSHRQSRKPRTRMKRCNEGPFTVQVQVQVLYLSHT